MFDVKAYIASQGNPAEITKLYLSGKDITHLDEDTFENLTQLKRLNLEKNQLTSLPPKIFENLTQLEGLSLSRNQLKTIPPKIFENLTKLEGLSLSRNQLTSLPPKLFENLTQLKWLILERNQLTNLPPKIFENLTQLEMLTIRVNQLNTLPPKLFENLTQLKKLTLGNNRLSVREQNRVREWAEENDVDLGIESQDAPSPTRRTSPQRSPQRRTSSRRRTAQQMLRGRPTMERDITGTQPFQRTSPQRSPQRRTSPQRSPQQPFDVTCINDDDVLGIDDFTKGHKEFEAERRVIILNEGNSREGNCFGLKTVILAMMNVQNGKPTLGPWRAMNQMGSNANNRYFKLPYPNVWVDLEGMKKLLDGWKVLRLKYLREERIGSFFGVGTLHGHKEKIYTLAKVNSKYQGKNKPLSYKEVDNHTRIFLEIDENFIHLFSE